MTDTAPRDATGRREHIVGTLRSTGFRSVTDLAAELDVSDMTVRRDLRRLEREGHLRIVHGGASLPHGVLHAPAFDNRADTNTAGKRRIAAAALRLLDERDTIAVDAGTTAYQFAAMLPDAFAGCLVTHSVPVIQLALASGRTRLVGVGGDLHHPSKAFVGPMTVDAVSRLRLRTFFLGAGAIDARGVYVGTDVERPTKQALMGIADRVVLLVDSTKFHTSAPVLLCGLGEVSTVVTDRAPTRELGTALRTAGVRLVVADARA